MDKHEAKELLALYRPGSTDAADPRMAEALDMARRDPELKQWLDEHAAVNVAIRAKLKGIPVPAGLKRQIIINRQDHARIIPLPGAVKILLAAAAIVILTVIVWFSFESPPPQDAFGNYRDRMARSVQRGVPYMSMAATNQAEILDYFVKQGGPADLVLSQNLQQLPGEGGSVLTWNNHKVGMLCLNAGTPSAKNDLWIFVMAKSVLVDAPAAKPQFLQVANLMTASWTTGDKVYILAAAGTQKDLQKLLEN